MLKYIRVFIFLSFFQGVSAESAPVNSNFALFRTALDGQDAYHELLIRSDKHESRFLLRYLSSMTLLLSSRFEEASSDYLSDVDICNIKSSFSVIRDDFNAVRDKPSQNEMLAINSAFKTNQTMIEVFKLDCSKVMSPLKSIKNKLDMIKGAEINDSN